MKSIKLTGLILFVFCIISAPAFAFEKFTFVAMGDSRGAESNSVRTQIFTSLCRHCSDITPTPDFVIFTGDMVEGSKDPNILTDQRSRWKQLVDKNLKPKLIPVIGNHEAKSLPSQSAYAKFFSDTPANGPEDEKNLTFYFDHKNCRFILLDTNYHGSQYRIRHMDWLEEKLSEARKLNFDHIFVFGHSPAFQSGSHFSDCLSNLGNDPNNLDFNNIPKRDAFWHLLKKYNVSAYICGHEHKYSRQKINGLCQILSGGAGAPLYDLSQPCPDSNASPAEQKNFKKNLPYYKALGLPHNPGQIPVFDSNGVFLKAYHYVLLEVSEDSVNVKTYGFPEPNDPNLISPIKLLDEFKIPTSPNRQSSPPLSASLPAACPQDNR